MTQSPGVAPPYGGRRRGAHRASRRHGWSVLVIAVVGVAALAVVAHARGIDLTDPQEYGALLHMRAYVEVDGKTVAVPLPAPATGRVVPAVPVTTAGSYAFLHVTDDGLPIGYDPCRPVRYVERPEQVPPGGEEVLSQAIEIVSAASGLSLVDAGTTDEKPVIDRTLIQPSRYGSGWAPVFVAWSTSDEMPELKGRVAGVGGSAVVPGATGDGRWLAAGRLVLDSEDLGEMIASGDAGQARAIIIHELCHVLGLDHVNDPNELMNPVTSGLTDLGPGDRAGLALVGQVSCQR
jgi:hypothetical protein